MNSFTNLYSLFLLIFGFNVLFVHPLIIYYFGLKYWFACSIYGFKTLKIGILSYCYTFLDLVLAWALGELVIVDLTLAYLGMLNLVLVLSNFSGAEIIFTFGKQLRRRFITMSFFLGDDSSSESMWYDSSEDCSLELITLLSLSSSNSSFSVLASLISQFMWVFI